MDKGPFERLYDPEVVHDFSPGLILLRPGDDATIVATGIMVTEALKVTDRLAQRGVNAAIIDLYRLKPVNDALLVSLVADRPVITLEEHTVHGGLGSIVCEALSDHGSSARLKRIAIPDTYHLAVGSREWLRSRDGLDVAAVTATIESWLTDLGGPGRLVGVPMGAASAAVREGQRQVVPE